MANATRIKSQAVRVRNVAKLHERRRRKPVRRLLVGLLNGLLFFVALAAAFVAPYVIDAYVGDSIQASTIRK